MTARALSIALRVVLLCAACACACGGRGEAGSAEARAFLAGSESAHTKATELLARGDTAAARAALEAGAGAKVPGSVSPRDARVVRQDLYYRLAELELGQGRAAPAEAWANQGLALGRPSDVFVANLLIARGRAREALGQASGASADYHAALLVSEALLEESLGAKDPR